MSRRCVPAIAVFLVAALGWPAAAGADDPLALARYFELRTEGSDGSLAELEQGQITIDGSLVVVWDEDRLRAEVLGIGDRGDGRATGKRLESLRELVVLFLDAQAALAEATAAGAGGARASAAANEAHARAGARMVTALDAVEAYEAALRSGGRSGEADRFRAAANEAILEDYAAVADAVSAEVDGLAARVRQALASAPRYTVQMRATLASTTGSRRLHLAGYDHIEQSDPTETPRFQLGLDARAEAEVRAAGELAEVVRRALEGELGDSLKRARDEIQEALRRLAEAIRTDVLEESLEAALASLEASGEAGLEPLRTRAEELIDALEALGGDAAPFPAAGDAELLLAIVRTLSSQIQATLAEVRGLDDRLQAFLDEARIVIQGLPGAIEEDTLDALDRALAGIRGNPDVAAILADLVAVRRSLGLAAGVAVSALEAAAEAPRDILGDLDTRLDLVKAGERHSGEVVILEAELREVAGDDSFERGRAFRRVRLRLFGPRVEPRGALLFADPRNAGITEQGWEPAPAVSYMLHWGSRRSRLWNDLLDPGIGLSMTLLDFSDEDDLEVGMSASLSLFQSLLWVGYGRNIQAEASFFYVGVNPLVIGKMWSGRQAVLP